MTTHARDTSIPIKVGELQLSYIGSVLAQHLGFIDEINRVEEIDGLKKIKQTDLDRKELELGKLLLENLSSEHFDASKIKG